MSERKAVIKNADMSEEMQQDAVDCATQALEKYNIEKVSEIDVRIVILCDRENIKNVSIEFGQHVLIIHIFDDRFIRWLICVEPSKRSSSSRSCLRLRKL